MERYGKKGKILELRIYAQFWPKAVRLEALETAVYRRIPSRGGVPIGLPTPKAAQSRRVSAAPVEACFELKKLSSGREQVT
jgi:hypothetical protein